MPHPRSFLLHHPVPFSFLFRGFVVLLKTGGVPGADSSWGGPKGLRTGTPVDPEALHAGCKGKASGLHNSPARLQALLAGDPTTTGAGGSGGSVADSDGARVTFETSYVPQFTADAYTWGSFETEESLQKRMKGMVEYVSKAHPGETVLLVSHGGPTASCYDVRIQAIAYYIY